MINEMVFNESELFSDYLEFRESVLNIYLVFLKFFLN